ncbi:MAG: LysM peptidoglycan-binding domain-containing protein [Bacillota bacterium]
MRRKKTSLLFGLWFFVAALLALVGFLFAGRGGPESLQMEEILVKNGDTLWSIATKTAPETDPRVTIDRIVRANGLSTLSLRPGQRLLVPKTATRGLELARIAIK